MCIRIKNRYFGLYEQIAYCSGLIRRPTPDRRTQYTSHILSLHSNKLTNFTRRQNGLQTADVLSTALVQTIEDFFGAINHHKRSLCGLLTAGAKGVHPECQQTVLHGPRLDPHRSAHPRKKTDLFPLEFLQVYLFCFLITRQKAVNSWRTSPERNYSGVAILKLVFCMLYQCG